MKNWNSNNLQSALNASRRAGMADEEEDSTSDDEELPDDGDEDSDDGSVPDLDAQDLAEVTKLQEQVKQSRHPTLFTYMGTKPRNQLSRAKQGPHTVSFCAVSLGIDTITQEKNLDGLQTLFRNQVDSPADFDSILDSELSATNRKLNSKKIERVRLAYAQAYKETDGLIAAAARAQNLSRQEHDRILDRIRSLMEMDPYQTRCWKGGKASKSALSGKKEAYWLKQLRNGDESAITGLMDISRASFKNEEGFQQFLVKRIGVILPDRDPFDVYQKYFV